MKQGRSAFPVPRLDVRAGSNQQFSDRGLIGMRRGVQRRRAPVIIFIMRVDVGAGFDEQNYHFLLAFPRRAMQRRRAILITRIDQRGIGSQ